MNRSRIVPLLFPTRRGRTSRSRFPASVERSRDTPLPFGPVAANGRGRRHGESIARRAALISPAASDRGYPQPPFTAAFVCSFTRFVNAYSGHVISPSP
jgi:hypothetical protein